ncbi:NUDIX domain-containing protein [Demequina sp. SYSU T00192]|uniref:NUDIX domain-containing protein n=1 Tax=Demequina litoralis TaxID=3051660 RepID=A0ABT8GC28_9MICO|nr:NUDIX domain-containing protein [Demequina sp. SYSU T00192]MDN4476702.1 NUDIX domain-containing protein [Demequina sp. SYSU T00192]
MATPDFIHALRAKVGHAPLWLMSATAVVVRPSSSRPGVREVLLAHRADFLTWATIGGIIDPGEQPAVAAARELREEAGVEAEPETLAWVHVQDPAVYPNGDHVQFLDLTFRFRWISGEPFPADGENLEVRWFDEDDLPRLSAEMTARVAAVLEAGEVTRFEV